MPQKCESPAATGLTRESLAGLSRFPSNLAVYQTQFLIAAHFVRPEMTAMVAALAFGSSCHG